MQRRTQPREARAQFRVGSPRHVFGLGPAQHEPRRAAPGAARAMVHPADRADRGGFLHGLPAGGEDAGSVALRRLRERHTLAGATVPEPASGREAGPAGSPVGSDALARDGAGRQAVLQHLHGCMEACASLRSTSGYNVAFGGRRMRRSWTAMSVATVLAVAACTSGEGRPAATPNAPPSGGPTTSSPTATLASGVALPEGCDRGFPDPRQVVAFVAGDRAWAIDPDGVRLTCLFTVAEAGPFAWGPQADRVLLGGLEVRGVDPSAPSLPAETGKTPSVFDWGRPIGLAVVYASGDRSPQKRFID